MTPHEKITLIETFFSSNSVFHQITPNQSSKSCKDAANKRNRLGNTGIPIIDELKSNIGFYIDEQNTKHYVILHCRGNQLIDQQKVKKVLGFPFERMEAKDLKETFDLEYGIVNPLISIFDQKIIQLFDTTVFDKYLPPYTMMTNAGHCELGLEFFPNELFNLIESARKVDIIEESTRPKVKLHTIGILTGNSPESGIVLWEMMNNAIREKMKRNFLGDTSFPQVHINSVPSMGLSMELELREEETRNTVLNGVRSLCESGATLIAIACNTTQYFKTEIQQVCDEFGARYLPMVDCVQSYIVKNKIKSFDFLGIQYVTHFQKWSDFKALKESFQIHLPEEKQLMEINELAFEVKLKEVSGKGINKLRDLINHSTKTNNVLIALTELSILLKSQQRKKQNKQYIDTLSILAESLAEVYLDGIHDLFQIPTNE